MNKKIEFIHNGEECIKWMIENYDSMNNYSLEDMKEDFQFFLEDIKEVMIKRLIEVAKEHKIVDIETKLELNHCPTCDSPHIDRVTIQQEIGRAQKST